MQNLPNLFKLATHTKENCTKKRRYLTCTLVISNPSKINPCFLRNPELGYFQVRKNSNYYYSNRQGSCRNHIMSNINDTLSSPQSNPLLLSRADRSGEKLSYLPGCLSVSLALGLGVRVCVHSYRIPPNRN